MVIVFKRRFPTKQMKYDLIRKDVDSFLVPLKDGSTKDVKLVFYVDASGNEVGMSMRGLAALCGVTVSTITQEYSILNKLQNGAIANSVPNYLEPFVGSAFIPIANGEVIEKDARIVKGDVCAGLIRYYAYDARSTNEVAQFSLGRFMSKGFNTWVKEITNYSKQNAFGQVLALLSDMNLKITRMEDTMNEMKPKVEYIDRFTKVTIDGCRPGLKMMVDDYVENAEPKALPTRFTASQWLASQMLVDGYPVPSHAERTGFGRQVYENLKVQKLDEPKYAIGYEVGLNHGNKIRVLDSNDLPILKAAYQRFLVRYGHKLPA